MAKTATPQVGMNMLTARSGQYVTIREIVPAVTAAGVTLYRQIGRAHV